jgi:hypothetical protein
VFSFWIPIQVWPALYGTLAQRRRNECPRGKLTVQFIESIEGAKDCPVTGTKLPLVIVPHGRGGWFGQHDDTVQALANAGFVVASINLPGDNGNDSSQQTAFPFWHPGPPALSDCLTRTAVLADTAIKFAFPADRWADIKIPLLIWRSEFGGAGVDPKNSALVAESLPGKKEVRVVPAGHFAFLSPCSAEFAEKLPRFCTDPPGSIGRHSIESSTPASSISFEQLSFARARAAKASDTPLQSSPRPPPARRPAVACPARVSGRSLASRPSRRGCPCRCGRSGLPPCARHCARDP